MRGMRVIRRPLAPQPEGLRVDPECTHHAMTGWRSATRQRPAAVSGRRSSASVALNTARPRSSFTITTVKAAPGVESRQRYCCAMAKKGDTWNAFGNAARTAP